MYKDCSYLQSRLDSPTQIVPTCLCSCARIRDKIGGTPMTSPCSLGFPTCHQATLFSRNDFGLFSFISFSAHLPSLFARQLDGALRLDARPFSSLSYPFACRCSSSSFSSSFFSSSHHCVGWCSSPIRETRHDFDISLEVARDRVDH